MFFKLFVYLFTEAEPCRVAQANPDPTASCLYLPGMIGFRHTLPHPAEVSHSQVMPRTLGGGAWELDELRQSQHRGSRGLGGRVCWALGSACQSVEEPHVCVSEAVPPDTDGTAIHCRYDIPPS